MISGYMTAADTILYADNLASVFRGVLNALPAVNALAVTATTKILGDGTTTNPGLANGDVKAAVKGNLPALINAYDYTRIWAAQNNLASALDTQIRQSLPATWNFLGTVSALHFLDAHLTRINAGAGAPVTGANNPVAGTLTATNNPLGALPSCTAGNAPRVCHSLVGASDYLESLPSGEATQVALTGSQDSYSYQITGTVPVGVFKVRLYRGLVGGATGFYYWSKDVAVTPGAAYPAILILEGDPFLRQDITPPGWISAPQTPEFAGFFALGFSGSAQTSGLFTQSAATGGPIVMSALAMLSPGNVVLNPITGFLGVGNPTSTGRFGAATITGSGTKTYAAGSIQTVNNPGQNVQGFAGALGLQSRVTTALSGGAAFSLTYTYYDQANGWGNPQTSGATVVTHLTGALGETIAIPVIAGRVVQTVTINSVSGAATSGVVIIEAAYPRTVSGPTGNPVAIGGTGAN